jgi:hypothetical protein
MNGKTIPESPYSLTESLQKRRRSSLDKFRLKWLICIDEIRRTKPIEG